MSGGSYNYLFLKDAESILQCDKELDHMIKRLKDYKGSFNAAHDTIHLQILIQQYRQRVNYAIEHLKDVWQAVEWRDSGDSGDDHVLQALALYNSSPWLKEKK